MVSGDFHLEQIGCKIQQTDNLQCENIVRVFASHICSKCMCGMLCHLQVCLFICTIYRYRIYKYIIRRHVLVMCS